MTKDNCAIQHRDCSAYRFPVARHVIFVHQWNISITPISFGNLFPPWIIATFVSETGRLVSQGEAPNHPVPLFATGIKIQRRRFYRLTFPLFLILPF